MQFIRFYPKGDGRAFVSYRQAPPTQHANRAHYNKMPNDLGKAATAEMYQQVRCPASLRACECVAVSACRPVSL